MWSPGGTWQQLQLAEQQRVVVYNSSHPVKGFSQFSTSNVAYERTVFAEIASYLQVY